MPARIMKRRIYVETILSRPLFNDRSRNAIKRNLEGTIRCEQDPSPTTRLQAVAHSRARRLGGPEADLGGPWSGSGQSQSSQHRSCSSRFQCEARARSLMQWVLLQVKCPAHAFVRAI